MRMCTLAIGQQRIYLLTYLHTSSTLYENVYLGNWSTKNILTYIIHPNTLYMIRECDLGIHSFIHSKVSIAPLQVPYYSEALWLQHGQKEKF